MVDLAATRRSAGLSQRELAALAGTSQATLSAYESGRKQPSAAVLARLIAAMGYELCVVEAPGRRTTHELRRAGEQLAEVLALAEALPFRREGPLGFSRLPVL